MLALWNYMDALMCQVLPSSLGDLGLKWFNKLPKGLIKSFHQLTESFVAQFIINTKAPKGVSSLLTLRKGKKNTSAITTSGTEKCTMRSKSAPRS